MWKGPMISNGTWIETEFPDGYIDFISVIFVDGFIIFICLGLFVLYRVLGRIIAKWKKNKTEV